VSAFQHLSIQETALRAAGCHVIRAKMRVEPRLRAARNCARCSTSCASTTCLVTRIYRLTRSIGETSTTTWAQGDCDRLHQTQEAARMPPLSTPLWQ
jgi:hypothetical protein